MAICGLSFSHSHPPVYELAKKYNVPVIVPFSSPAAVFAPIENDCREVFSTGPVMHPKFHYHGYAEALLVSKLFPKDYTVASTSYATPGGRILSSWGAQWCEKFGYKVVYHEDVPPGTVDLTTWAEKVAKANPDVYLSQLGGELLIPFWSSLEKVGWTKSLLIASFMNEGDFVKAVDGLMKPRNNIYWFGNYAPSFADIPEYDEIRKAMKKFRHKYTLSANHARGWTTARLIEAALSRVGWPCDRQALFNTLEKTDLDTKGLTGGKIRFSQTDHYGTAWGRAYQWEPGKRTMLPATDWIKIEPNMIAKEYSKWGK